MVSLADAMRNLSSDDTLKLITGLVEGDKMIDELHVQNVALIKDATMIPSPGLTVITGETGAGKTALLSSLKLLSGERAEADMVREGTQGAAVEGRFFFRKHRNSSNDEAQDNQERDTEKLDGLDTFDAADDDGTVVKRTLSAEGRSRVYINGDIASVRELAHSVGRSIDLCGQHDHQQLMKTENHRQMLDAWAGDSVAKARTAYAEAFADAKAAQDRVDEVISAGKLGSEEVEQAKFILRRIDEVNPQPDEYDELKGKLPLLENAEQLKAAVNSAHMLLSDEGGVLDKLAEAAQQLEDVGDVDASLGQAAQTLRDTSYAIEDVSRDLSGTFDDIDYDQSSLEDMQNRMSQLQDLMHSFGPQMSDVMAARDKAQETVDVVEGYEDKLKEAKAQQDNAEDALAQAARKLHDARAAAAPKFAKQVTQQISHLQLQDATLTCDVRLQDRSKWTKSGADEVEFMYQPGSGMRPRPLAKIASGGEMSRVILALKVILGEADNVDTLVFDEVDAGVGGTAARAIATVLRNLSRSHQVIVVTHLAQVAVVATKHYVVRKTSGDIPETELTEVSGDARINEIARMLSGDTSKVSREHASQMLKQVHEE